MVKVSLLLIMGCGIHCIVNAMIKKIQTETGQDWLSFIAQLNLSAKRKIVNHVVRCGQ